MINSRELKERLNEAKSEMKSAIGELRAIGKESERASDAAKNAGAIIESIGKNSKNGLADEFNKIVLNGNPD